MYIYQGYPRSYMVPFYSVCMHTLQTNCMERYKDIATKLKLHKKTT